MKEWLLLLPTLLWGDSGSSLPHFTDAKKMFQGDTENTDMSVALRDFPAVGRSLVAVR